MTISPFTIYLWQLCDSMKVLFSGIAITLIVIFLLVGFVIFVTDGDILPDEKEDALKVWRIAKVGIGMICVCAIFDTLMPSSKTIAMMVVIPKLAESKAIQQDLPDVYDLAVKALKEQLAPAKK